MLLISVPIFTSVVCFLLNWKLSESWLMTLDFFFGHSNFPTNLKLSSQVLLGSWLIFSFYLTSFYDGNLRAYLMATDFEDVVNSDLDIINMGRRVYTTNEPSILYYFLFSPFERQRKIGKKVWERKRENLFKSSFATNDFALDARQRVLLRI